MNRLNAGIDLRVWGFGFTALAYPMSDASHPVIIEASFGPFHLDLPLGTWKDKT